MPRLSKGVFRLVQAQNGKTPKWSSTRASSRPAIRGDLEAFASCCEDEQCRGALARALESPDSAAAFRQTLLRYPKEEAHFFQFKEHQALERAQTWLAGQGIPFAKPVRSFEM